MKRDIIYKGLIFCAIFFISGIAFAEDKWTVILMPTMSIPSIDGKITVNHKKHDVDYSWGKLKKYVKEGGSLAAEIRKGKHGFLLSGSYLKAGYDATLIAATHTDADLTATMTNLEGLYAYRFLEAKTYAVDAFGGGRYWRFKANVDVTNPPPGIGTSYSDKEDWVDPVMGLRFSKGFTEKLSFIARGDLGGFGVGSHFTWDLRAALKYQFTKHIGVMVGYDYMHINYGNGNRGFRVDAAIHGPSAGLVFTF